MTGRGRGIAFKPFDEDSDGENDDVKSDELSVFKPFGRGGSAVSSIVQPSIGRGRGLGRGVVDLLGDVASDKKSSDSGEKSKEDDQTIKKTLSSGRGSGRGRASTSGIGSGERTSAELATALQPLTIREETEVPRQQKPPSPTEEALSQKVHIGEEDVESKIERELATVAKHGKNGLKYDCVTNCIFIQCDKNFGVCEYEVRFQPEIDNMRLRSKYLYQLREELGDARTFDGVTLYLPRELPEEVTQLTTQGVDDSGDVNVTIIFRRRKRLAECIHMYNVLFERIMGILQYQRVGRKSFDPTAPKIIAAHKLEVWPGFVKSVEEQEGGLMLLLDVSHRVLSQKSVLEFMRQCLERSRGGSTWKDMAEKGISGNIVLTRYNNKSYKVDGIDFSQNPSKTFRKGGREITIAEYYKNEYNITIQDMNQPMLMSRNEVRVSGQKDKEKREILLVPELCYLTGLSDEQRSNYNVMRDLATHTKLAPFQRVAAYKKFIENIANNEKASELLSTWGLTLEKEPAKVTARLLDEEIVIFGNDKSFKVGPQADFGKHATSNQVLEAVEIINWIVVCPRNDAKTADAFETMISKICGPTGIRVNKPRRIELPNDRNDTYVNELQKLMADKTIQIAVVIFPTLRDDRYAAVKQLLCAEMPRPSQCINSKTLKNDAKNRSIVQKILLQMNCKLGGSLWGIKIPLRDTMIIGIDTYHEVNNKGLTVGAFVASVNSSFTRYYSRPAIQKKNEELINGLVVSMVNALDRYKEMNDGKLPERIIMYRDGVGDGQLQYVESYEIPQFEDACRKYMPNYNPKISFVVVQKRINHKFFKCARDQTGKPTLVNPPPGSVLDNTVTRRTMYDFFLCSQHVREGTTTPSHYIILRDDNDFDPDIFHRLTYKLTFLYYNWVGTVRVPAPCQYAHKLAYLVGLAVKRQVDDSLTDKLFYL